MTEGETRGELGVELHHFHPVVVPCAVKARLSTYVPLARSNR